MLNRTNRSLASLFDIPNNLYALSNLTWTFIRVHKTKSHGIRLSHQVHFKSKILRNSFRKFYLGLNRGANELVTPEMLQLLTKYPNYKKITSRERSYISSNEHL